MPECAQPAYVYDVQTYVRQHKPHIMAAVEAAHPERVTTTAPQPDSLNSYPLIEFPSTCMELLLASGAFPCRAMPTPPSHHQAHDDAQPDPATRAAASVAVSQAHACCSGASHLEHIIAWGDAYHVTWGQHTWSGHRCLQRSFSLIAVVWRGLRACVATWGSLLAHRHRAVLDATGLVSALLPLIDAYLPALPVNYACHAAALACFETAEYGHA